jgi:tetratricopeptide (TPR) repeat protein/predicted Ser/Thr protein kinase
MRSAMEGSEFGHYRLGRLLGAGGMGEVYLARDTALDRDVAIKFVITTDEADESQKRRLVIEGKALASLDHPGICRVYDAGVDSMGRAFIVMQYVEGETLAARLKQGPLAPADAINLCTQVAEALAVAHEAQIIHRDLKPQNVIVTPTGQPKLVDFGIAKTLSSAAESETVTALTKQYAIVGTPAYMAPEQAQQRPVDQRTDLFALGTIFFECLTGRRPFGGETPVDVIGNVIHQPAPLVSQAKPALGTRYDEVCQRLLEKSPEDRYQSATETTVALRSLAHRPPRQTSKRLVLGLSAALVVLLAAVAAPRWMTARLPEPPAEAQVWFLRGTEAVREQSYYKAVKALEAGIGLFPDFPMAYLLLAEARRELDDHAGADRELVRLTERFPNTSALPSAERLRLSAVRLMLLGKFDESAETYKQIAETQPTNPGAWVDLGRAREAAGQLSDARAAYERAIGLNREYAPAHLRLGTLDAGEGEGAAARQEFDEAARLYKTALDVEGQTETLIRSGMLLDNEAKFAEAADTFNHAIKMATAAPNPQQVVRAQMRLSSATVSLGRFSEAEDLARTAVDTAVAEGWLSTAADGLIDYGTALMNNRKYADAAAQLERAITFAERTGAVRIAARAKTQRAEVYFQQNRPTEALALVAPQIVFFRQRNYRLQELDALSVAAKAYLSLDKYAEMQDLTAETLRIGRAIKDDIVIRRSLATLSQQAAAVGNLPAALQYRSEAEETSRQAIPDSLPYDVLNRAQLLIGLGRVEDAEKAFQEVERGIATGNAVYIGRQRSVHMLRAYAAIASGQYEQAAKFASLIDLAIQPPDEAAQVGQPLLDYAKAKQHGTPPTSVADDEMSAPIRRERRYWIAAAYLHANMARDALSIAVGDLKRVPLENDELRWRLAAIAAAASDAVRNGPEATAFRKQAGDALGRLRAKWSSSFTAYETRKDLSDLRRASRL